MKMAVVVKMERMRVLRDDPRPHLDRLGHSNSIVFLFFLLVRVVLEKEKHEHACRHVN